LPHHQFLSVEVIETFSDSMKGGCFRGLDVRDIFNHFLKIKPNNNAVSHHTIHLEFENQ